MKKYILSFLVIATFAVYVVYQRMTGTDSTVAIVSVNPTPTTDSSSSSVTIFPVTTDTPEPTSTIPSNPTPTKTTKPTTTPVPVQTVKPTPRPTPTPTPKPAGLYRDGQYTGISADAYYGNIQVMAIISGGKLTDVQFLDYPQDRGTSVRINTQAMPYLRQEAIQAQSANVNTVSGASDSSGAFRQSLASALSQAKNS